MKFIIICLITVISLCQTIETHPFRYKNGSINMGEKKVIISGSLWYKKNIESQVATLLGIDYDTMTPLLIMAYGKPSNNTLNVTFGCSLGTWGKKQIVFSGGLITMNGSLDKSKLNGECSLSAGEYWIFNTSNVKADSIYYSQEEAGLRAKNLIGQTFERYKPSNVIDYAIRDFPYLDQNCSAFLHQSFPETLSVEPGAIIVGKDGEHCAIVDNEGTKFVHSNPILKKVTHEALVLLSRYFPKGVVYRRYPKGN